MEETPSRLGNWAVDTLLRLLDILERSVIEGENARVFVMGTVRRDKDKSESPTKGKGRGKAPKRKRKGELVEEDEETEQDETPATEDVEERGTFRTGMERLTNAVFAADACLTTLSATDMPKQVRSMSMIRPGEDLCN